MKKENFKPVSVVDVRQGNFVNFSGDVFAVVANLPYENARRKLYLSHRSGVLFDTLLDESAEVFLFFVQENLLEDEQ